MLKHFITHSKEIISAIIAGVIIAIISTLVLDYIYVETGPDETVIHLTSDQSQHSLPQLWSHHKLLDVDAVSCANQGEIILTQLGFNSIVTKDNFVYGNKQGNRAAIKCVDVSLGKTFVYLAVAGQNITLVEHYRNEIAWKF